MSSEESPAANQLLSRASLRQGQLESPLATLDMENFEESIQHFLESIETSKAERRYHYRVFNASVQFVQAVRPFLQPGRCRRLVPSLRQVIQGLEEVEDQDHGWRAELMMHLITCLVDSGEFNEATNFARVTETFIKSHIPHLYSRLFILLVRHKLKEPDILRELSSQCTELSVLYKLQKFKDRLKKRTENASKQELEQIFHLLAGCPKVSSLHLSSIPAPMQPADRVALLLELALLALHVKHQQVAASCLKELKSMREASVGQRIVMECVNSEINLLKRDTMMNVHSRASVEACLREISKLDQWLQSAVREGDPQAMQAVCATQWRLCLPLLLPKFRKYIRTPLLNVAKVLEEISSLFVEMRCQLHSELAAIEEEQGRLEASLTHLQKALLLDNGTQRERLSSALHLLHLRASLDQMPSRHEDQAAQLMLKVRDLPPQDQTDIRPTLVSAGLLLAPNEFQMVLDADDTSESCAGSVAQLCEKAKHHSASVCKVEGHLARQGDDSDSTERVRLWATLGKTAAKHEVWDVCRAACRFCLLYDDGRWSITKTDNEDKLRRCSGSQLHIKDLLRLLTEIHFINAEATIQKLLSEGGHLNAPGAPPVVGNVVMSEEDPLWIVYRAWIQELSTYAISSLLRAAKLGREIKESWVVENAATHLWNYSPQLLAAGQNEQLLPALQTMVELLLKTDCHGHPVLLVLLCDTVARGIIQPLTGVDQSEPGLPADEGKKQVKKEGAVLKALQLCEQALSVSSCSVPGTTVPIAVLKQLVATWVQIKQLLHQQIGSQKDAVNKCENEAVMAVLRVLVGVEMHQCNRNPRHMEFSVLSLSELVKMTSECSWSDALVELQVWCQLATFCYEAEEHSLLLQSMEKALMLEEAAATSLIKKPFVLHGQAGVSELLCTVTSLKGLMIIHMSNGDLQAHKEAMKEFLSSVSYAEKAENPSLCVTAARHFWNSCLPFIHIPEERHQLQEPLEKILLALIQTRTKYSMQKGLFSLKALSHGCPSDNAMAEQQNLTLTAAIYIVLLHNHIDKTNWKGALELLAKAIRDTPCSRQQFVLQGHRILVKARFGENIITDMRKLQKEREINCSSLWHQAALCAVNITQQLAYYKNCITSFKSEESQWQKANVLLEFGEWLYQQNFSKDDGKQQVHLAIDILLQTESGMTGEAADNSQTKDLGSLKCKSLDGFQEWLFPQSLAHLTDVRCLDNLVRAHVLLAVMAERTSPEHQLNLLRAFTVVLQIWQVSMAPLQISPEIRKSPKPEAERSKTGKGKNVKDPSPGKDKAESLTPNQILPTTPKGWAEYVCPELARQTFGTSRDLCCINTHSITNQTRSLYFLSLLQKELLSLSLGHLTPPILHLAEAISSELLCSRSLSDLYGLGIVKTCCHLGLETNCPYQDKLINMTGICEQELMECRKAVVLARQRKDYCSSKDFREGLLVNSRPDNKHVNTQNIWVDKAKLCVSMELYQAARELLSEASLVSVELQDHKTLAKTLLTQANLACAENNFDQALISLDKAQALGGDENFWYQLTLTFIKAVAGQRKMDAHIQIDQIIYKGCEALKMILKRQMNRISKIKFLITSLQMRGAVECVHVLGSDKPRETLSTKVIQALLAAYETLRECASVFTELSYREHAAEAHKECAYFLRLLASNTTDVEDKQQFLLDGLSQIQLAVSQQEHVVLNVQTLFPSQSKSQGLSLDCVRQLQHLRVGLADFALAMLGQHCAEKSRQAVAWERMTSAEKALEEFLRCAPEPNSTEEKWIGVGMTLEQLVLDQLAGVDSQSQDTETKAHCLHLRGRFFRMLAVQTDPLYLCALWDGHEKPRSDPEVSFMERRGSKVEADKASDRGKSSATSAKSVELQQQPRCRAQQLLSSASQALAEATSLCLQNKLPPTILADAALTMVECHGQWDPVLAGQYLALFQSCCAASAMADVLSCACGDTSTSQLSAVFTLHKNVLVLQKEKSSRMLKEVEDSLNKLSKSSTLLTISPNHLNILAELPSNLRILLLQHSKDGSELYGAFYEKNQHGKNVKDTGRLACSRVAKVSVCPQALQALREQCLAFSYGKSQDLHEEAGWPTDENSAIEETLESSFKRVVQHMDEYLNPLLSQFDFSSSRPQDHSLGFSELSKSAEKERNIPEPEQYVVLLADMMLMDLPLEALSILQEDSFCSVSRDFSLQLLHSRLRDQPDKAPRKTTPVQDGSSVPITPTEPHHLQKSRQMKSEVPIKDTKILSMLITAVLQTRPDLGGVLPTSAPHLMNTVASDTKKETKGGKKAKGKKNQSKVIKETSEKVLPSNTFPVDLRNFKYIVDVNDKGVLEETSLSRWMQQALEKHHQSTHPWTGFLGSQQKPSRSEMEQLLCTCSGFIYLGMEPFVTTIPPDKIAALNMSECRVALLFDFIVSRSRILCHSAFNQGTSQSPPALEKPSETALLMSLCGVGCVVLHQWPSSLEERAQSVDSVLDRLLRVKQTCGQAVHALRRGSASHAPHHKVTSDEAPSTDSVEDEVVSKAAVQPSAFSCLLYGLPNLAL